MFNLPNKQKERALNQKCPVFLIKMMREYNLPSFVPCTICITCYYVYKFCYLPTIIVITFQCRKPTTCISNLYILLPTAACLSHIFTYHINQLYDIVFFSPRFQMYQHCSRLLHNNNSHTLLNIHHLTISLFLNTRNFFYPLFDGT